LRIQRGIQFLLPLCVVFLLLASSSLAAPAAKNGDATEITLDFKDVELVDLISTISELTGKNFIYDEGVKGKVSIISPRPVSIDEAYKLFTTVLNVKGFTIVPSGKVNKIVPTRSAKEENLPISQRRGIGEQYVTRLIDLKNLDAQIVTDTILRPLIPKTSWVVSYEPTNTVIITDSAANIDRLAKLLDKLDNALEGESMEVVPLQYADATETADLVMQIMEGSTDQPTRTRRKTVMETTHKKVLGQVIAYERTNKLMLVGDQEFIAAAKAIIPKIDEKGDLTRAGVHVYYLENAQAEELAKTLNEILSGATQDPKAPRTAVTAGKQFGDVSVTADKPTNSLIVNASTEDYNGIKDLIAQLDIRRKQVYVEALILELGMDKLLELGASLQGAVELNGDSVAFGTSNLNRGNVGLGSLSPGTAGSSTPSLLTQAVSGILLGGMFNPITTIGADGTKITIPALSALIQLSKYDNNINVLSAPRLLTSDNEEAEIVVGANVPIITSKTKDTAGQQVNSVERKDVALTLRFTPQINEGNLVRLKIYQEISDVAPASANIGDPNEVGPSFTTRKLSNSIIAQDGKTVVLGGMFQTNRNETEYKVPLLGDIPLLGALFRSTSKDEKKTSLLIFITPKVIHSSEDLEQVTKQNQTDVQIFNSNQESKDFFAPNRDEQPQSAETPAVPAQPAEAGD